MALSLLNPGSSPNHVISFIRKNRQLQRPPYSLTGTENQASSSIQLFSARGTSLNPHPQCMHIKPLCCIACINQRARLCKQKTPITTITTIYTYILTIPCKALLKSCYAHFVFNPSGVLSGRHYSPHFIDGKTEAHEL